MIHSTLGVGWGELGGGEPQININNHKTKIFCFSVYCSPVPWHTFVSDLSSLGVVACPKCLHTLVIVEERNMFLKQTRLLPSRVQTGASTAPCSRWTGSRQQESWVLWQMLASGPLCNRMSDCCLFSHFCPTWTRPWFLVLSNIVLSMAFHLWIARNVQVKLWWWEAKSSPKPLSNPLI